MTITTGNSDRGGKTRAFAEALIEPLTGAVEAVPSSAEERGGVEGSRRSSRERS